MQEERKGSGGREAKQKGRTLSSKAVTLISPSGTCFLYLPDASFAVN